MSKGKGKTVFAREATGLVREIGWFTAIALVMSAVIGAGINGFAVQSFGWASTNSVSTLAMVLFVAIPFFCSAICLGIMSSAMPRSGGPYVIISRAVSPAAGYLATWGSWVSIAFSIGLLADYDIVFWGSSLSVYGYVSSNAGLIALGSSLGSVGSIIIGGAIITLVITLIAALGVNIWGRVVQILFIIPVIGSIFTFVALLSHTAGDLQPFWDAVFGAGSYATVLSQGGAVAPTGVPYTPDFLVSIVALPGIIFAYTAFYASSYVGGEVKNPKRNMITSTVLGMLLIILFFVGYTGGLARAVGEPFLYSFATYGASSIGVPAILPLFASVYTYTIPLLAFFISVTGALWLLNDLPPFYLIATRSTFAWAFDRHFPEKFSEVSERFHSPVWSVVLCAVLALPMVVLFAVTPIFSLWFTTTIDVFTYLFICVAGLFFIKKFKSQYEKSSKLGGPATLYFFAIVGVIFWLILIGFLGYFLINPAFTGEAPAYIPYEFILPIATFVIGYLVYLYFKLRNKKMGIDVRKIYGEIPPE